MRNYIAPTRAYRGLSLSDVASQIAVAPETLAAWEAGGQEPSVEDIVRLADIFDVPVDFLLCRGCECYLPTAT